jgi:hypothetical protein
MTPPSLSDVSHLDPCRICKGYELRADLLRASKVMGEGKRGYVCVKCAKRRGMIE